MRGHRPSCPLPFIRHPMQHTLYPLQHIVTLGAQPDSSQTLHLPNAHYHAEKDRQSCSMLKQLLVSPAHYQQQFFAASPHSAAMNFGSLIHTLVLEPRLFHLQYAVWPAEVRTTTKEGKLLAALDPGKTWLTDIELHEAQQFSDQILYRTFKGRAFGRYLEEGLPEATFHYTDPDTGVPCRVRHDLWHPDFIFDLKTTRHAQARRFAHAAVDLHYDLQAFMYSYAESLFAGRAALRPFVFIAAESTPPYSVSARPASAAFIDNGRDKYRQALTTYAGCVQVDYWPDAGVEEELDIEPWQAVGHADTYWSASRLHAPASVIPDAA
jgi:hypothetical protein